jgi:hypothetical protein
VIFLQLLIAARLISIWQRRSGVFSQTFLVVWVASSQLGISFGGAMQFYPGDALNASTMCQKVARNANDNGGWTTMRRTEAITRPSPV